MRARPPSLLPSLGSGGRVKPHQALWLAGIPTSPFFNHRQDLGQSSVLAITRLHTSSFPNLLSNPLGVGGAISLCTPVRAWVGSTCLCRDADPDPLPGLCFPPYCAVQPHRASVKFGRASMVSPVDWRLRTVLPKVALIISAWT